MKGNAPLNHRGTENTEVTETIMNDLREIDGSHGEGGGPIGG